MHVSNDSHVQTEIGNGRLLDFSFRPDGFIADYRTSHPDARDTITDKRLDALSSFVRARAQELLKA